MHIEPLSTQWLEVELISNCLRVVYHQCLQDSFYVWHIHAARLVKKGMAVYLNCVKYDFQWCVNYSLNTYEFKADVLIAMASFIVVVISSKHYTCNMILHGSFSRDKLVRENFVYFTLIDFVGSVIVFINDRHKSWRQIYYIAVLLLKLWLCRKNISSGDKYI